eukprot:scaffold9477_cov84-Skeletonema_dohrnii-CCMP3373.AAC.4
MQSEARNKMLQNGLLKAQWVAFATLATPCDHGGALSPDEYAVDIKTHLSLPLFSSACQKVGFFEEAQRKGHITLSSQD